MTKKDYELIAQSIKMYVDSAYELRAFNDKQVDLGNKIDRTKEHEQFSTLGQLVGSMTATFERDNPKFNEDMFKKACGFTFDR